MRAIELPPGEWEMTSFGDTICLVSPDHPAMIVEDGELKVLGPVKSGKVLFVYDSHMNVVRAALNEEKEET